MFQLAGETRPRGRGNLTDWGEFLLKFDLGLTVVCSCVLLLPSTRWKKSGGFWEASFAKLVGESFKTLQIMQPQSLNGAIG